jgi:hypothetical protein
MIPVKDFLRNEIYGKQHPLDVLSQIRMLTKAGYFIYDFWHYGFVHSVKCLKWCQDSCPNEYVDVSGMIFFDDKDTAMIMKLSVL